MEEMQWNLFVQAKPQSIADKTARSEYKICDYTMVHSSWELTMVMETKNVNTKNLPGKWETDVLHLVFLLLKWMKRSEFDSSRLVWFCKFALTHTDHISVSNQATLATSADLWERKTCKDGNKRDDPSISVEKRMPARLGVSEAVGGTVDSLSFRWMELTLNTVTQFADQIKQHEPKRETEFDLFIQPSCCNDWSKENKMCCCWPHCDCFGHGNTASDWPLHEHSFNLLFLTSFIVLVDAEDSRS